MNRLRALRKERNLLQAELARQMHISQSAISDYENGKRVIDLETAVQFAEYFGVTLDYFAGRSKYRCTIPGKVVSQRHDELFTMIMQLEPMPLQYVTQVVKAAQSRRDT